MSKERAIELQKAAARAARHSREMLVLMDWERSLGYGHCHWGPYDVEAQVRSAQVSAAARLAAYQCAGVEA